MTQSNRNSHDEIADRLADSAGVQKALKRAASETIRDHARSGHKIVVWRDNQIVGETPTHDSEQLQPVNHKFIDLLMILKVGLDNATDDAVNAVIEIQSTPIPADKLSEAIDLLVEFIKKHRSTNSQKVLIAVGAAIRKVLLNVFDEQLGLGAELMKSAGSLEVPIEVELEVSKMIVHRFRYTPNTSTAGLSELATLILENARVYSKTNLVNRDFYNATALNSVLAIVLMRHKEASALLSHIESVSPQWFVDLVKNRLRRMATELENEKLPGSRELINLMNALAPT